MSKEPKINKNAVVTKAAEPAPPAVFPITGSKSGAFSVELVKHAVQSMPGCDEPFDQKISVVSATMQAVDPRNEIEGMLAVQMIAVHNASMECFKRAMISGQPVAVRDYNLNHANKLSRTFTMQIEALNRYRGMPQQKMTVEHVHVHSGGQAIVGNVNHPSGGAK